VSHDVRGLVSFNRDNLYYCNIRRFYRTGITHMYKGHGGHPERRGV
jgi:hypothetical protein